MTLCNRFVRMSGLAGLAALGTVILLSGYVLNAQNQTAVAPKGRVTRIHDEKNSRGQRLEWTKNAVERSRKHLASAVGTDTAGLGESELVLKNAIEDDLDQTHVRFLQMVDGVPVFGTEVIVQLDHGSPKKVFGKANAAARRIDTRPTLDADAALTLATLALGYAGKFASPPHAELTILPRQDEKPGATLTYMVELMIDDGTDAAGAHRYFIDAHDGHVVWHYDAMTHATGYSAYSGVVSIGTTLAVLADGKNLYRMWDQTRGDMYTIDMFGTNATSNGALFSSATNVWGGTYPYRDEAGVDAQFGASKAWDYFRAKQGWLGLDGRGLGTVNRVHYGTNGTNFNNAFSLNGQLTFGDGDGYTRRTWVTVDLVAHEYTHGVVERTAGLVYSAMSGAINESFADIFGTAVEFYAGSTPDYYIGEDSGIAPIYAMRSMSNPPAYNQPDHLSRYVNTLSDSRGVHINSGIQNKAFYLLAVGGTHPLSGKYVAGVSRPVAEWIFFQGLQKLPPLATFSQVRAATISAAATGYGSYSSVYYQTIAAWDAVGVY